MPYEPQEVSELIRSVRRRCRAFGWEVEEAVSIIQDAVAMADKIGHPFSYTQSMVLESIDEAYEEWEAGELDGESELEPEPQVAVGG